MVEKSKEGTYCMICVSFIVPIYNIKEEDLKKCIESIKNQTLNEIEIILVDDGSTNNSGLICDEYCNDNEKITVIHQKNKGLCAARNVGYRIAKGEYISFVDADDWIELNFAEIMYMHAKEKNVDVISCKSYREYPNRTLHYNCSYEFNRVYLEKECKKLQEDILEFSANNACVYAKIIKKSLLDKYTIIHDEELRQGAEGIEFNIRLYGHVNRACFIEDELYHYRYNGDSISNKHNENNHYLVLKCFEKIKNEIMEYDNYENLLKKLYERLVFVVLTTAISGYFSPKNKESFRQKKEKYNNYLKNDLLKEAIKRADYKKMDFYRKVTFYCIKKKLYICVSIIARIRYLQKIR